MGEAGRLAAVILAGGTAARMDGADKASLEVGGVTLLERALAATIAAVEVVVVGDEVPTSRPVTWAREEPPGGGPAAALLAGLEHLARTPEVVTVLAVDMPGVGATTLARLVWEVEGDELVDGAVLVDASGKRQTLAAAYRMASLDRARPLTRDAEHGLPMRVLVGGLRLVEVPALRDEARDVDTWADLRDLRARYGPGAGSGTVRDEGGG